MIISCSPCPAMDTTGPGRLKISLWTPPTVNTRTSKALVAQAAQPWPRQIASTSSSFGISTVHSLFASHELKWTQWSLLKQRQRAIVKYLNVKKNTISENTPIYRVFIRDLESVRVVERNYKLQLVICRGVTFIIQELQSQLHLQHCRFSASEAWSRDSLEVWVEIF